LIFSDLREVILKMFGDQHLEKLVLQNATTPSRKSNLSTECKSEEKHHTRMEEAVPRDIVAT